MALSMQFTRRNRADRKPARSSVPTLAFSQLTLGEDKIEVTYLSPQEINFSQRSVSASFTNGNLLSDLIEDLISGVTVPTLIEPIRIVKYRGQWTTLDNRRLRVFKDALVSQIPVVVCDLGDKTIAREFHEKRTNKSIAEGGVVKAFRDAAPSFDDGIYVFNKRVLSWTFEQLEKPLAALRHVPSLPDRFPDRDTYYESFHDLIFEEARAVLQAGIEQGEAKKPDFEFSLVKCNLAKNPENPCTLTFNLLPGYVNTVKFGDALLLIDIDDPENRLLALANYVSPDNTSHQIAVKVVIEEMLRITCVDSLTSGARWSAKAIGSLIPLVRMFEACSTMPETQTHLETELIRGELLSVLQPKELRRALSVEEKGLLKKLNISQKRAVKKFLHLEEGMQFIQGPPGTGKTTTIVAALKILCLRDERILVCAPSNKAVQILAERFVKDFPDEPVVLVGVEDKLPPEDANLRRIFLHTWGKNMIAQLQSMQEKLWHFLPEKLLQTALKSLPKMIPLVGRKLSTLQTNLSSCLDEAFPYQLTFLENIEEIKLGFGEATEKYIQFISKQTPAAWKSAKNYIDRVEAEKEVSSSLKTPEILTQARQLLSRMAGTLSQLILAFGMANEDDSRSGLEAQLIDHSSIIFATLSVVGRRALKEMSPVQSLIVDEAGQCVEAEVLIALAVEPEKCLFIGDVKQLPATVFSTHAVERKFSRSLMERFLIDREQTYEMLDTQYRMHPDISVWPSRQYYEGELQDDEAMHGRLLPELAAAPAFLRPYAFIDIASRETNRGHSFINEAEASVVQGMIACLHQQYKIDVVKRVGVITFYKGQADHLNKLLQPKFSGLKIHTVDGFQGGECDFIIISFVRANARGTVGFLGDFRRLNVALTRARFSLIMVGNAETLQRQDKDVALLVADAHRRGLVFQHDDIAPLLPKPKPPEKHVREQRAPLAYSKAVCRFFNGKPRSCRNGDRCDFSHVGAKQASFSKGK